MSTNQNVARHTDKTQFNKLFLDREVTKRVEETRGLGHQ